MGAWNQDQDADQKSQKRDISSDSAFRAVADFDKLRFRSRRWTHDRQSERDGLLRLVCGSRRRRGF